MKPKSEMTKKDRRALVARIVIRFSLLLLCCAALVLVPAGTWHYWQAYLYITLLSVPMVIVLLYFLQKDPQFLERRMHSREREKRQRPIVMLATILFLLSFIVPGLDRRFGWSQVPIVLVLLADGMHLLGYLVVFLVFRENSFASRIVEIDPKQQLVTTELYRIIRQVRLALVIRRRSPTSVLCTLMSDRRRWNLESSASATRIRAKRIFCR